MTPEEKAEVTKIIRDLIDSLESACDSNPDGIGGEYVKDESYQAAEAYLLKLDALSAVSGSP